MLKIKNLHAYYGPIKGLKGVDLEVRKGEISCLIGSNGSGKTTLLKAVSGMIKREGSITYNGEEIINKSPRGVTSLGILHVPEGRHVFPGLTVRENLEVGTITWHSPFYRGKFDEDLENIYTLFPRLKEREKQLAWSLSGGEQQMLAIGRSLMGRPSILMMDEPSMGLAPVIVEELFKTIVEINKQGIPILLVEQNAVLALSVSHYAYVVDQGYITLHGKSAELRNDARIAEAYLGKFAKKKEH